MKSKLLEIALGEYGNTGKKYKDFFGIKGNWCGLFVAYCLHRVDGEFGELIFQVAREWLKWGVPVIDPKLGDIVVFWRSDPNSWKGHVGIVIKVDNDYVWTLGGNQWDGVGRHVCIKKYKRSKVLGFREAKDD